MSQRLWVVEYSVNGGAWHLSIHDFRWFRVAETRHEAEGYASLARGVAGFGWRYRVVEYVPKAAHQLRETNE